MIKEFNSNNVKKIIDEINNSIDIINNKYDIDLKINNIKFNDHYLFSVIDCNILSDKEIKNQEKENFEKVSYKYGLSMKDFGKKILLNGEIYKIVSIVTRNKLYPIIIESKGKRFKIDIKTALTALNSEDGVIW